MGAVLTYAFLLVIVGWTCSRWLTAIVTGAGSDRDFTKHAGQAMSIVSEDRRPLPADDTPPPLAIAEPFGPPRWAVETFAPLTPYAAHAAVVFAIVAVLVLLTS